MKYKFYTKSNQVWAAMLTAIESAVQSIYLESFILNDDELTRDIFTALKEKARAGVKVKIIIDRVGGFLFGSSGVAELQAAGADVVFFSRWWYRTHRKLLVVDERVGFIGGVNIHGAYAEWLDLHVQLTAGPMVNSLVKSFLRVYRLAGGQDQEFLAKKKPRLAKTRTVIYKAKCWLLDHFPVKGRGALKDYYKRKCAEAKEQIVIVTPYFVPHRWLVNALRAASRRGVKIDVLVPTRSDIAVTNLAHRIFAFLLKDFISFYFIPEMNHAKVLLVDNREGLIGSNNIDAQSFDLNLEVSIHFQRKDMVGDLKKILDHWRSTAIPFEKMNMRWRWYHSVLAFLIRLIQPIL